jgi:Winged helix DNA-binding domain
VKRVREPTALTTRQLNRALLARQLLLERKRVSVHAAVHAAGALQSQEPKDPFVALWSRISAFKARNLLEAAHRREIVRGTYLRGTLHTATSEDFAAFRLLLQPVVHREEKLRREYGGGFEIKKLVAGARALLDGGPLSAQELGEKLGLRFPAANKTGLAAWVRTGVPLITIPTDDRWGYSRPPRFLAADGWLQQSLKEAGSADNMVLRCLSAIGPASSSDVRAWSGLGGIRQVLDRLRPQLMVFSDELGRELFDLAGSPRPHAETPAPVRFLPEYDNVFLSHADRGRIMNPAHAQYFTQKGNGRRLGSVLVDGFVRAGWEVTRRGDRASMDVTAFERFTKSTVAEVSEEALALLRFTEPDANQFAVDVHEARKASLIHTKR